MATESALFSGRAGSDPGPAPAPRARARLALRLAGGGLLIATGAIHLDLYLTGYRSIPTIGWLLLLQVIAAFLLGAVVLASAGRLAAAAGAVFALATLGGYTEIREPAHRAVPPSADPATARTTLLKGGQFHEQAEPDGRCAEADRRRQAEGPAADTPRQ